MAAWLAALPRRRRAYADAAYPGERFRPTIGLNTGWENMLLNGDDADNDYKTNNHGLMFTLTLGLIRSTRPSRWSDIDEKFMDGFQLEQELGLIDVRHKGDTWSGKMYFKGATLVGVNIHQRLWNFDYSSVFEDVFDAIYISPKLGVGAIYMQTPEGAAKSVQAWFAVRSAISFNFHLKNDDDDGWIDWIGLEFEYTMGLSTPNVFDCTRVTHFVSIKLKSWI